MKILLISNGDFFSTYGGGQVYVKNLVDEMIRQELDVVVFSFIKKSTEIITKQNYKGIDLYEISEPDKKEIKELLESINPDVVHAHSQKAFFAILCKELNIPYIVTAHHGGLTCPAGTLLNHRDEICHVCANDKDCLPCVMKNTRWGYPFAYSWMKFIPFNIRLKFGLFLKKLPFIYFVTPIGSSTLQIQNKKKEWKTIADNVDLMIAPSNAIAENMILNGLNPDKIQVVPHGIPISTPQPLKGSDETKVPFSAFRGKIKFFNVGGISYEKGIHVLLKAFSQLNANDCELHIIGSNPSVRVQKLLEPYRNRLNIIFHGKINPKEILSLIQNFDVLIHPAIYLEVFGLVISEALSQNKPVIATRCGGAEMQIIDKENGLLIPPNDEKALIVAMQYMIDHPEEIERMSANAPKNVISLKEHIHTLVSIYHQLK